MRVFHTSWLSLSFVVACAAGGTVVEDPPGAASAGAAGTSTAGAAGVPGGGGKAGAAGGQAGAPAGGAAGDAGAGGTTTGGAAGDAGAGGTTTGGSAGSAGATTGGTAGSTGGMAGASGGGSGGSTAGNAGTAGDAGSAGNAGAAGQAGSSSGGAGSGGAGSGGAGSGGAGSGGAGAGGNAGTAGAGGGTSTGPRILAVVTQAGTGPYVATFTDGGGWVDAPAVATTLVGRPGVARRGDVAMVVMRQTSNALVSATWANGALSTFVALPGFPNASDGVSLAASADGTQLAMAYLGTDNKHYGAVFAAVAGISATGPLGADTPQAFGDSPASVAVGGAVSHAAYSGTNDGLYYLQHGGSQWNTSAAIAGAGSKKGISPTVVVAGGKPSVVFVEGGGNPTGRVCISRNSGGGFDAPSCLAMALTSRQIGAAALPSGEVVVAWHGLETGANDQRIFAARFTTTWGNIIEVDGVQDVASAPVVVPGLGSMDAEILYAKAGKLRHARLVATTATSNPVGAVGATDVGAAVIP